MAVSTTTRLWVLAGFVPLVLSGCASTGSPEPAPEWTRATEGRAGDRYQVVGVATAAHEDEAREKALESAAQQLVKLAGIQIRQIQRSGYTAASGRQAKSAFSAEVLGLSSGFLGDMEAEAWHIRELPVRSGYKAHVRTTLPATTMARMRAEAEESRPDSPAMQALLFGPAFAPPIEAIGIGSARLVEHDGSRRLAERRALRLARLNAKARIVEKGAQQFVRIQSRIEGGEVSLDQRSFESEGYLFAPEALDESLRWEDGRVEATVRFEAYLQDPNISSQFYER